MSELNKFSLDLESGTHNEVAYATWFEFQDIMAYRISAENCYDRDWGTGFFFEGKWMPAPDLYIAKHNFYIEAKFRHGWTYFNNKGKWQIGLNQKEIDKVRAFKKYSGDDIRLWITVATLRGKDSKKIKSKCKQGTGVFELKYDEVKRDHQHYDKDTGENINFYNAEDLEHITDISSLKYAHDKIRERNKIRYKN